MSDPVLLIDGVCNLCHGLVGFVLDHERKPAQLRFGALQSPEGKALAAALKVDVSRHLHCHFAG